jgi:uncharacterized alkaline shock family protein YloU
MQEESRTDLGTIRIHDDVVASIAAIAAEEIEGVKAIGGRCNALMQLINRKPQNCIRVEKDKNDEVKVDIPLVVKFGYNVPDVASKVQENVRIALERMTSITLKDVNINVQGIERG